MAQHRPIGSETPQSYTPRSSGYGSALPSVEDAVDIWRYAILELHARNNDNDDVLQCLEILLAGRQQWYLA